MDQTQVARSQTSSHSILQLAWSTCRKDCEESQKREQQLGRGGEVPRDELEAEFEKIWKGGFSHAEHPMQEWITDATDSQNYNDLHELTQNQDKITSLKEMMPQVSVLA